MSLTPGLQIPFGIQPVNPVPVDVWSGPYIGSTEAAAISAANLAIPAGIRFQSLQVRLIIAGSPYIYWYYNGVADIDLVYLGVKLMLSSVETMEQLKLQSKLKE